MSKYKRKRLQIVFTIGINILNCIANLGYRIPIAIHYSEIKILFPLLRKLNTGTDNQLENVKY